MYAILPIILSLLALARGSNEIASQKQLCSFPPFQLISVESNGKLAVTDSAKKYLSEQCFSDEFQIVSVSGSFHTGKSFLLNALMNSTTGFNVGDTTESETRGLWLSGSPIKRPGTNHPVVFLDTEGLAAVENTEQHDAKIYSISTLLSAHQIYNTIRNIDTRSIEALELLARRARLFQLKTGITEFEEKGNDDFLNSKEGELLDFPSLTWVIQNFFQKQMPGETPTNWLHRLLVSVASSKQIVSGTITSGSNKKKILLLDHPSNKNEENDNNNKHYRTSSTLKNIFAPMNAVTMAIPSYNPSDLQDLSKVRNINLLNKNYLQDLGVLWKSIELSLNRESARKQSGKSLYAFLKILVQSANDNNLDEFPSLWFNYIDQQKKSAQKAVSNMFIKRSNKYDLAIPLPMKTYVSDMNRIAKMSNFNVVQLLFGLSSPTIENAKETILLHINSLKKKKIQNNIDKISMFSNSKKEECITEGIEKLNVNCIVPSASSKIKRESNIIKQKYTTKFLKATSNYDLKYTSVALKDLKKALNGREKEILENNRLEMEKIMKNGEILGSKAFNKIFQDATFPGDLCHTKEMYAKLKNDAVKAATTVFDSMTELCKTETYYSKQKSTAIQNFKNLLDSKFMEKNENCIVLYVQRMSEKAEGLFDRKSARLEDTFPMFDNTAIDQTHKLNHEAMLERFRSTASRFRYHSSFKNSLNELNVIAKKTIIELKETNTRLIKKSVKKVLKEIKDQLKRTRQLRECLYGPFDFKSCVTWFRTWVQQETGVRLKEKWEGQPKKLQHIPKVVEMFLQTDLHTYMMEYEKQDSKNESTKNRAIGLVIAVCLGLFVYFYTKKENSKEHKE